MRLTRFVAASALLLTLCAPSFAQDAVVEGPDGEEVSDAVDIAMFCGAAFTAVAKEESNTPEQREAAEQLAAMSFARAEKALNEDNVDPAEYDQLVDFYVEAALSDMSQGTENMRYSSDECVAEAQK